MSAWSTIPAPAPASAAARGDARRDEWRAEGGAEWRTELAAEFATLAALAPDAFSAHFARPRPVGLPELPAASAAQLANADALLEGRFCAVGECFALGARFSWTLNPSRDKEWQIAHHKFYGAVDLAQAYRATGRADYLARWHGLIESWLDEMGSGFITASDAQVEAKRLEHWVTSFLLIREGGGAAALPAGFLRRFLGRLGAEAAYVAAHLRPARNHRTFQLYALFLVGLVFPELRRAHGLVAQGRDGLCANLAHDFGADGVHIELSSHYHQITLETALSFVDLAQRNGIALPPGLIERLQRAAEFAMWLTWPDGRLPLINDADDSDHRPLFALAARLFKDAQLAWTASGGARGVAPAPRSKRFAQSGYFVLGDGWGHDAESFARRQHVFYDCGPLGEGSHSQYDLFNLTYFAGGRPILVDPGRYTYCADPGADGIDWRHVFKSTASHNTVTIDGRDQTRYLSKSKTPPPGFERYERAVHPHKHGPAVELAEAASHLGAAADSSDWICGTARSHEYTPLHTRLLAFVRRQYLVLIDRIDCSDGLPHRADLRFHFAAAAAGRVSLQHDARRLRAAGPGWQLDCLGAGDNDFAAALEAGWVSTTYGIKDPAPVLSVRQHAAGTMAFATVIASAASGVRIGRIDWSGGDGSLGVAVELATADGAAFRDLVLLRAAGAARYEEPGLAYDGAVLISRRAAAGLEYLCASHPAALEAPELAGQARGGWQGEHEWTTTAHAGRGAGRP